MDFSKKITVIGGDARQEYIYKYLKKMGFQIYNYEINDCKDSIDKLKKAVSASDIIVAPVLIEKYVNVPLIYEGLREGQIFAGGSISEELTKVCHQKNIFCYDYMKSESLSVRNAVLTGEGALSEIIKHTPFALNGTNALVIGYGKCGSVISLMLSGLECKISIIDNSLEAVEKAEANGFTFCRTGIYDEKIQKSLDKYDFIVNTVPDIVLDNECLSILKPDCILFDIASKAGFDNDAVKNYGLRLVKLSGLPGRFSPKTAGELIAKDIIQNLSALK